MDQLSHTLEVKPNLFIRAFISFYGLRAPYGLNTCKLFWGGVGMVVIPPLLLIASPVLALVALLAWVNDKHHWRVEQARRAEQDAYWKMTREEQDAYDNPPPKPKTTRAQRLEQFSAAASAVWFKIATPVTWFFRFAVGAGLLAGLYFFIPWVGSLAVDVAWGSVLVTVGLILLGAAVATVIIVGILMLVVRWREKHPKPPKAAKKRSVVKAVFHSIHDHTCANVEVKS